MKVINLVPINNKIVPSKVKEARTARGLSLAELSRMIGVSSQAISQYEQGKITPSPNILMKLVDELEFPIGFFCDDMPIKDYEKNIVYFRSHKNITNKLKEACKVKIKWIEQTYRIIKDYFELPMLDLVEFDIDSIEDIDENMIEELAYKLRQHWNLSQAPIKNFTALLQEKGFVVTKLMIGTKKVDAFSKWNEGVPYIFVGADKGSACRLRFDLAHELGHLIMHKKVLSSELKSDKEVYNKMENQANYFAGAFLLPIEAFNREVISSSVDNFVILKNKWNVSISAMIKRCQTANILTDNQIRYLNSQMIRYHFYKQEPLDDMIPVENPYLFKQAFNILIENNIFTRESLLDELKLNADEVIELYSLDKDFFRRSNNILRLIK